VASIFVKKASAVEVATPLANVKDVCEGATGAALPAPQSGVPVPPFIVQLTVFALLKHV
jgi:hypothetical protein